MNRFCFLSYSIGWWYKYWPPIAPQSPSPSPSAKVSCQGANEITYFGDHLFFMKEVKKPIRLCGLQHKYI